MKKYQHIIFDLDDTIWDFRNNSNDCLLECYNKFSLSEYFNSAQDFLDKYHVVNDRFWQDYTAGKKTKAQVKERFYHTLKDSGHPTPQIGYKMNDFYLEQLKQKTKLLPNAIETLSYLKQQKYTLHLITNGFIEVQYHKIEKSGLKDFFDTVTTSEQAGALKPSPVIFEHTLNKIGTTKEKCVYIGDSLQSDYKGAKNAGIDFIFYNRHKNNNLPSELTIITDLKQLMEIF